jgi:hypothetical protein
VAIFRRFIAGYLLLFDWHLPSDSSRPVFDVQFGCLTAVSVSVFLCKWLWQLSREHFGQQGFRGNILFVWPGHRVELDANLTKVMHVPKLAQNTMIQIRLYVEYPLAPNLRSRSRSLRSVSQGALKGKWAKQRQT